MALQAQFGGGFVLPPYAAEEQQMPALKDYGELQFAAAATPGGDDDCYAWQQYDYCVAQSELTCNGGGGGVSGPVMPVPSRKRGREDEYLHYNVPIPGTRSPADWTAASTSGRAEASVPEDVLAASELWRLHGAEVDALVRAECDQLRAGLEQARKRQRQALARAAVSCLARRVMDAEAQLEVAWRRAAELEERLRLAAAEAQAWRGVAQGNEAVATGLQATLEVLLLRSSAAEGFGDSEPHDARSCCGYVEAPDTAATASSSSTWNGKWACRACCEGEASVLVLPCRHLCLCKACERRTDACPVCSGAKNAAIHIADDQLMALHGASMGSVP